MLAADPAPAKGATEPTKKPVEPAPKAVPPADDDPFADPPKVSSEANDGLRDWSDDTGTFHVRGRLVQIMQGKVRLLKDTGKYTTVPIDRLSRIDLSYVERQANRRSHNDE